MPYVRDSQSRAIRQVLLELGPDTPTLTVMRRLARRRIHVKRNLVNKTKSRLRDCSFWELETQRDLKAARAFVARVGSIDAAQRALQLLASID